jgi:hypothetical protein
MAASKSKAESKVKQEKRANPIAAFFASAFLSPFIASLFLLGTVREAALNVTKGAIGAVMDIVIPPLAVLGAGAVRGWKFAGPYFPLNILTAAIGLSLAVIPAAAVATLGVVAAAFDIIKGVCNAAWTLFKGITMSAVSLIALPIDAVDLAQEKSCHADQGINGILLDELGIVACNYRGYIENAGLFDQTPAVLIAIDALSHKETSSKSTDMNFDLSLLREDSSDSVFKAQRLE